MLKFSQTGHCLGKVGISHLATHHLNGSEIIDSVFPFKLTLVPAEVRFQEFRPESMETFMDQFRDIPVGSTIYEVKAHANPNDVTGSLLGTITTTGKCITSYYGDTKLFFRHRPIKDDIERRPEWKEGFLANCGNEFVS